MKITSASEFDKLSTVIKEWRARSPMYSRDILKISRSIDTHIQNHSRIMVEYRRTRNKFLLEKAQLEIDKINGIIDVINDAEFISILCR